MKYKISKNIEITDIEDECFVICFNVDNGESHILDEPATAVLKTVGNGMSFSEAAEAVSRDFYVQPDEVLQDIIDFAKKLLEMNIIVEDKENGL